MVEWTTSSWTESHLRTMGGVSVASWVTMLTAHE